MKGMLSHTAGESKSTTLEKKCTNCVKLCTNKQYIFKFEMSGNCGNEHTISMFNAICESNKILLSKIAMH